MSLSTLLHMLTSPTQRKKFQDSAELTELEQSHHQLWVLLIVSAASIFVEWLVIANTWRSCACFSTLRACVNSATS